MLEDTSPKALAQYLDLLRRASVEQKARAVAALCSGVRQLVEAGLRQRHPGIGDSEVRVRFACLIYGREAAKRLFGSVPDDAESTIREEAVSELDAMRRVARALERCGVKALP